MAETLRLFVSATNDLEAERAVIGRAVAQLPVKIGIEIRRTPVRGADYETIHELVANVDRFYFLMGEDISAPAGAEAFLAWKLERSIMPLRSIPPGGPRRTPAAQDFLRLLPIQWQNFQNGAELAQLITLDLIRILQHPKNRYGLTLHELELLNLHQQRAKQLRTGQRPAEAGGAEGGGVLLDEGHREPMAGVMLGEK